MELTKIQKKILNKIEEQSVIFIKTKRQAGITTALLYYALKMATEKREHDVLFVCNSENEIDYGCRMLFDMYDDGFKQLKRCEIILDNGNKINFVSKSLFSPMAQMTYGKKYKTVICDNIPGSFQYKVLYNTTRPENFVVGISYETTMNTENYGYDPLKDCNSFFRENIKPLNNIRTFLKINYE